MYFYAYFIEEELKMRRNKHAQVRQTGKGSSPKLSDYKACALDLCRTELEGSGDTFLAPVNAL